MTNDYPTESLETRLKEKNLILFEDIRRLDRGVRFISESFLKPRFMAKNDHDHAKRMLLLLVPVVDRLPQELSVAELYVLCAAIYLHDIGMYCYFYLPNHNVESFNEEVFRDLDGGACLQLYNNHAKFSKRYIEENHARCVDILPLDLTNLRLVSSIAELVETHKDPGSINKHHVPGTLRLRLLKALLQFADAGDMTVERAIKDNRDEPAHVSFGTYWKFYYIDGPLHIERDSTLVFFLRYRLPERFLDHFEDYALVVESRFRRFCGDAVDIINEYGISIEVDTAKAQSELVIDNDKEMMPDDVLQAIEITVKQIRERRWGEGQPTKRPVHASARSERVGV